MMMKIEGAVLEFHNLARQYHSEPRPLSSFPKQTQTGELVLADNWPTDVIKMVARTRLTTGRRRKLTERESSFVKLVVEIKIPTMILEATTAVRIATGDVWRLTAGDAERVTAGKAERV